jgi:mannose/cellobiose epimerase-like protein (N-acyl-D-glucosamine 2-epimerase family)
VDIGERWGVDAIRDVAINEIWDDMSTKDAAAKIWPQTERLKAWCAMLAVAGSAIEAEIASGKIVQAGISLSRYLLAEPAGLWHEVWSADGSFAAGPSKASSLYHIACAIDTLRRTSGEVAGDGKFSPGNWRASMSVAP